MKRALILLALLSSCRGPVVVQLSDGTKIASAGHLGGKDYLHYSKSAAGAVQFTTRSDEEASFQAAATAGVSAYGAYQLGLSNRASTASDTAIAVGAQKATTAQAVTAGAVETARIKASTIIPK